MMADGSKARQAISNFLNQNTGVSPQTIMLPDAVANNVSFHNQYSEAGQFPVAQAKGTAIKYDYASFQNPNQARNQGVMLGDQMNNQFDAMSMSGISGFDASSIADPVGTIRSAHPDGHYNPNQIHQINSNLGY